jgi:hypothetical protein
MYVESDARYREFGGFNIGAAFFGWLVATGVAVLLLALLGALGVAIGSDELNSIEAQQNAQTIGISGAVLFVLVLMIAYYAGGYVAGRMSRFDGARQGAGAWGFGIIVTILLAVAGAAFGSQYNLIATLNLPSIPVSQDSLATGGLITLIVVILATLLAGVLGGRVGQRYHERVDQIVAPRV